MDLSRISNENKLKLCRSYFKVGCLLLPFVWAVNAVWFYKEAFRKPPYDEQKQIKKFVLLSAAGACVSICLAVTWAGIFQWRRAEWGATGDALSFIVPLGTP